MRPLILLSLSCGCFLPATTLAQCGGDERWSLKVAADPGAAQIDLQAKVVTSLHDLALLPRPIIPTDEDIRSSAEMTVRVVDARLVKFKQETGKTGDSDFHLVISDETLLYSAGGASSPVSPHGAIAEIPDPNCVGGRHGTGPSPSRFQAQLESVRAKFTAMFPNIRSGWNDAGGIPVRLTGIGFFDKSHGQVGRALNGLELHPLLDIEFNPAAPVVATPPAPGPTTTPTTTAVALANPSFEEGAQGWTASAGVITNSGGVAAHSGAWKAWLGGYGTAHRDKISQQVTLPANSDAISLTFHLHIDSEEDNSAAFDKLRVRVRDANGTLIKTVRTYSNQNSAPGFSLQAFDLSAFKGRTIIVELEAQEDAGSVTSFVVDDFAMVVEIHL